MNATQSIALIAGAIFGVAGSSALIGYRIGLREQRVSTTNSRLWIATTLLQETRECGSEYGKEKLEDMLDGALLDRADFDRWHLSTSKDIPSYAQRAANWRASHPHVAPYRDSNTLALIVARYRTK